VAVSFDIGTRKDNPATSGTATITAKIGSTVIGSTTFDASTATPGGSTPVSFVTQDLNNPSLTGQPITLSIDNQTNGVILLSNVTANRPYIDTFTVSSQADLNNAIAAIQVGGNDAVAGGSYQINITDPSIPTDALTGINLPTGAALTVVDDSRLTVSISGTVTEGSTLTATPTIGNSNDTGATVSYQWQNSTDGSTWSSISGATGSTYVLADADENKFVRVQASFTNNTGVLVSANSAPTATTVNDAALTAAAGASLTGTEGAALTGVTVATFSDANPNATVNDFTATITWGDGGTSAGTVVASGNGFAVTGTPHLCR
jgi:hypothetical protein